MKIFNRRELVIIGAGSVGGFLALNMKLFPEKYEVVGFLDDDEKKIDKSFWGIPVIGKIMDVEKFRHASIVIGISKPQVKKTILERIGYDFIFPNFISINSWVSNNVTLGKGIVIYPFTSINHESIIGDFSILNMNCAVGHNSILGRACALAPGVNMAGYTELGDYVEVGIGTSTIQKTRIGEGAVIGGQSMVISDVEAFTTYAGVPARKKNVNPFF